LRAQRNVSRAIYSQLPDSNVMVLLNNSNQIVLRGAAPSPSFRQRLMQLAGAAAGGYSLVDQLASEAVSSVAGTATSAAIGGVSDLIHHGSGSSDHGDSGSAPAYSRQEPSSSQTPSPPSGSSGPDFAANAPAGSSACVNVYNNNQVQLTGRAVSATDADRMRQFARQIAGSAATIDDQLATRINGVYSSANPAESTPATPGANAASRGSAVTPGSVVCLNMDNSNSVLLTGTVGSAADLSAVEQSVQSLLGNPRLLDQLNVGAIDAGSRVAATGGTSGLATSTTAGADAPRTAANAAIASPSQPLGTAASGTTTPAAASDLEQALHSIPRLSNVDAELTANSVRLSGSVNTPDDQQTAREIARQYAPGREILDNLTVAARDQGQVP
jgi:osmotically-inducible protein OsmY